MPSKIANSTDMTGRPDSTAAGSRMAACIGLAIALSLTTGCQKQAAAPDTQVEVEAATAQAGPITAHITTDAILAPLEQSAIAPKISAPVKKFYIQRGSKVKAGQLLATLENRDLSAAMLDNQGTLQAAQATYQTTVQAQVPQDYQRAELDLAQAKVNLNLNQQIVNSRKQLFAQGAIPGRDLDTAEAALVAAQATFDAAQKHFDSMQQIGRKAALENAGGQLQSAKGKYQAAEAALSYSEIRSPISGVVTDRPLFAGETASVGTPLVTVMNTSSLLAKIHLPQREAQRLKIGDSVAVTVPGIDGDVEGKITLISPALDPGSTTIEVWVLLKNPDGHLRPGTAVHVTIAGESVEKAMIVPSESIVTTSGGSKTVMVIDANGVAHQTPVKTGIDDDGKTQILSGLSLGQRVVTAGAYAMDDGTHVKVVSSLEKGGEDAAAKPDAAGDSK